MRIHLLLSFAAIAALVGALAVHAQDKKKANPLPVPTLKIKMESDGKGITAYHGDTEYKLDGSRPSVALRGVLRTFVAHEDKALGYAGKQGDVSANVLSLEIAPGAPQRAVSSIVLAAYIHGTRKFVLGTSGLNAKELTGPAAPDLKKLPVGYIAVEIKDEEAPSVPKEAVKVYIRFDPDTEQVEAVVAIDARARRVVPDSAAKLADVAPADGDSAGRRKSKQEVRDKWVENVVAYVHEYVINSGARIETIEIDSRGGAGPDLKERSEPGWLFTDLAYRAALLVNKELEENGNKALQILLPFQIPVAEPPPPEMPPEKEVEFPKDEPRDGKKDNDPADSGDSDAEFATHTKRGKALARSVHAKHVLAALDWLRDHQDPEGYWRGDAFDKSLRRKDATRTGNLEFVKPGDSDGDKGWKDSADIGLTGLSMLAFTAAGYDHKTGPYRSTIRLAVKFLRQRQDQDGCFGPKDDDHFVYNHGFAALALADLYSLSRDRVLKPMVEKAVEFILKAQNPGFGWRYGVQAGTNDTSVTGLMLTVLQVAKREALVDAKALRKSLDDAFEWFELVTVDVDSRPLTGYDTPGSNNARLRGAIEYVHLPTMNAIHGTCALVSGRKDSDEYMDEFRRSVRTATPRWEHLQIDFYYWYWGAKFLCVSRDTDWEAWRDKSYEMLATHQRGWHKVDVEKQRTTSGTLAEHGSWDPVGAWGKAGGRVYSTAMGALILQTEWRDED
jgi:hypothetical protein